MEQIRFLTAKELAQITNMSESWAKNELACLRKVLGRKRVTLKDWINFNGLEGI